MTTILLKFIAFIGVLGFAQTVPIIQNLDLSIANTSQAIQVSNGYALDVVEMSRAGDINGDGVDDIIFVTLNPKTFADTVYNEISVIYGSKNVSTNLDLTNDPSNTHGFTITSGNQPLVASDAGDFNGDGIDDILIGALGYEGSIFIYVLFGSKNGLSNISLVDFNTDSSNSLIPLNSTQGLTIQSSLATNIDWISVSSAGDINGDGINDVVIGIDISDSDDTMAYVIYGSKSELSNIDLTNGINTTQGFIIEGGADDSRPSSGCIVSNAGDVNGDGIDDLIFGQTFQILGPNNTYIFSSNVYIIYGNKNGSPTINLGTNFSSTQGFTISGLEYPGSLYSVTSAGDFNGDGYSDIIIGAPYSLNNTGSAYIIYGKKGGLSNIDLSNQLSSDQGLTITGDLPNAYFGYSVSGLGDVNGDGIDDFIIGAPGSDPDSFSIDYNNTGKAYVIYGNKAGISDIDLSNGLSLSQGYIIIDPTQNYILGLKVSCAGDFNGDGSNDIMLLDYGSETKIYIVFSPPKTSSTSPANPSSFSIILVIVILIVAVLVGGAFYFYTKKRRETKTDPMSSKNLQGNLNLELKSST